MESNGPEECLLRLFFAFFPKKPVKVYGRRTLRMRELLFTAFGLHLIQFVISLTFLGFGPMVKELAMAAIAFSGYLNLKRWLIFIYLAVLCAQTINGFYQLFFSPSFLLLDQVLNGSSIDGGWAAYDAHVRLFIFLLRQVFITVFTVVGTFIFLAMKREQGDVKESYMN